MRQARITIALTPMEDDDLDGPWTLSLIHGDGTETDEFPKNLTAALALVQSWVAGEVLDVFDEIAEVLHA